jgi:adenine-specific DNA-methyltransferase
MDKIQPGTTDGTEENIQKIAALFPEVMTEVADADGTLRHVVDYDALHELLG